ncbi:MAG: hypothetical protein HYS32_00095 [Candidatus Woesearchaeota archaeon]|nr:MAG: hypothetical protein HYS32_00095 [Candidatus Woesearchaeota archaeon]
MIRFEERMHTLVERTANNHNWRQRRCVNLIPSEQTPSLLVRLLSILDSSGRYAEHREGKEGEEVYFYGGTKFIGDIEQRVIYELREFLGATHVEPRLISGTMANRVVFEAMLKVLGRQLNSVVNVDLNDGGHLSAQTMGALFECVKTEETDGKRKKIYHIPKDEENPYRVDVEALRVLIGEKRPELIILGRSLFLFPEPVAEVRKILGELGLETVLMYDMAHTLGLHGLFQSPLEEGADILTGSTHKTFFGPQRGVIAARVQGERQEKLWKAIRNRTFPGDTSNHHLGTLLGLLAASYEMREFGVEYATQVRANAVAFARALKEAGFKVEGEKHGFTTTHQVVLDVRLNGGGIEVARRLEESNIITNYQALPFDKSFENPSGVRLGVQEMTRFGMKERDFEELARYLKEAGIEGSNIRAEVERFRRGFTEMKYCLPSERALPLALELVGALVGSRSSLTDALRSGL